MGSVISFYIEQDSPGFRTTTGLLLSPDEDIAPCALNGGAPVGFPIPRKPPHRVAGRQANAGADMLEPQWLLRLEPLR